MLIPEMAAETWAALFVMIGIYILVVIIAWYKHYRVYDYAFWFFGIGILYFIIYQFHPVEPVAAIVFINIICSSVMFYVERENLRQFLSKRPKEKDCQHFNPCSCGCGFGICKLAGEKIIDGRNLNICPDFRALEKDSVKHAEQV
ncbi:MAG: hypothetical protein ACFFD4_13830 [Candidatus Odinarchaeota archaeon]